MSDQTNAHAPLLGTSHPVTSNAQPFLSDVAVSSTTPLGIYGLPLEYASEDAIGRYERILQDANVAEYLMDFENEAEREAVLLGMIPRSEMEAARAQAVALERLQYMAIEHEHQKDVQRLERRAKASAQEIATEAEAKEATEIVRMKELSTAPKETVKELLSWFHSTRNRVQAFVKNRQKAVKEALGSLRARPHAVSKQHINWARLPQPVEFRLQALRGVKDKLKPAIYLLVLSKWTKLGGKTLRWSEAGMDSPDAPVCPLHDHVKHNPDYKAIRDCCEICQGWVAAALPRWHDGTFQDLELVINACCPGVFPPQSVIQPYAVLLFELLCIPDQYAKVLNLPCAQRPGQRGRAFNMNANLRARLLQRPLPTSRADTVAWGCFPVVNSNFQIIRGKFKVPMLRGDIDLSIEHFKTYEAALANDLEGWVGNLYFDAVPLPRVYKGVEEFQVDQEASRDLLGLTDAGNAYWELDDVDNWVAAKQRMWDRDDRRRSSVGLALLPKTAHGRRRTVYQPLVQRPEDHLLLTDSETGTDSSAHDAEFDVDLSDSVASNSSTEEPQPRKASVPHTNAGNKHAWIPAELRRRLAAAAQANDGHLDPDTRALLAELKAFNEKRLQEGTTLVDRQEKWSKYHFSLGQDGTFAHEDHEWSLQIQYVLRAVLDELDLRHPAHITFWLMIFAFVMITWGELWVRGFGLYIGLWMLGVPITRVVPQYTGIITEYKTHYMFAYDEVSVVVIAQLLMHFIVLVLMGCGWLFTRTTGGYPGSLSKFVYLCQLATFIVPFVTLVSDDCYQQQDSDLFRLIRFFAAKWYPEQFAYFTLGLLYLLGQGLHLYFLYIFTMYIHLRGVLIDAYTRINVLCEEEVDQAFMPRDFEISSQELEYIVNRAERWRGVNGERRKTLVEEIITTDANDPDYMETQIRIAIYTLDVGDSNYQRYRPKKIFREFYVLSQGSIIEGVNNRQPASVAYVLGHLQPDPFLQSPFARPSFAADVDCSSLHRRRTTQATTPPHPPHTNG